MIPSAVFPIASFGNWWSVNTVTRYKITMHKLLKITVAIAGFETPPKRSQVVNPAGHPRAAEERFP